jgi:hypothetical protein
MAISCSADTNTDESHRPVLGSGVHVLSQEKYHCSFVGASYAGGFGAIRILPMRVSSLKGMRPYGLCRRQEMTFQMKATKASASTRACRGKNLSV